MLNYGNEQPDFLSKMGLDEEPMGLFYTDEKPLDGFASLIPF